MYRKYIYVILHVFIDVNYQFVTKSVRKGIFTSWSAMFSPPLLITIIILMRKVTKDILLVKIIMRLASAKKKWSS